MTRSTASGVLPAAESEMIVTALFGYSCACASVEIASSQTHAAELAKLSAATNANVLCARLSMAFPLWIFVDGSRRFVVCRLCCSLWHGSARRRRFLTGLATTKMPHLQQFHITNGGENLPGELPEHPLLHKADKSRRLAIWPLLGAER